MLWGGVCVLQWMWCAGRWCKLEGKDSVVVCPKICSLKHQENRTGAHHPGSAWFQANGIDAASRRPLDNDGVNSQCIAQGVQKHVSDIAVVCLLLNIPSGFADYVRVVDRKRGIRFNLVEDLLLEALRDCTIAH